jgi:hypothetical protein
LIGREVGVVDKEGARSYNYRLTERLFGYTVERPVGRPVNRPVDGRMIRKMVGRMDGWQCGWHEVS